MTELLSRISPRELRLLAAGIAGVMVVALFTAIVMPGLKAFRAANASVAVLEAAAMDGAQLDELLADRLAALEALRYELHGDMAGLPAKQAEAYIIGHLQTVSWKNSVDLVSVEPTVGERIDVFQETLFNVRLSGRYHDLYRWLWQSRKELGFVVIKELQLSRSDEADTDPKLAARLSLAAYRPAE